MSGSNIVLDSRRSCVSIRLSQSSTNLKQIVTSAQLQQQVIHSLGFNHSNEYFESNPKIVTIVGLKTNDF